MWNVCTLNKIRQFHCYSSEVCGGRLIYVLSEKEKKRMVSLYNRRTSTCWIYFGVKVMSICINKFKCLIGWNFFCTFPSIIKKYITC